LAEKSKIREVIDSVIGGVIIFLFGEREEHPEKFWTKEEKEELGLTVRSQIQRYKERDSSEAE